MNKSKSISQTPEHLSTIHEFEILSTNLVKSEAEKEYLLNQLIPQLNALYLSKVGKFKIELLIAQKDLYRVKRKKEMIMTNINRQVPVNIDVIDILIESEMKAINTKLDEETKRLESAETYISLPILNAEESKSLKSLYYKLSKLLHPDLNPDQNETDRQLWLKVSEAHRSGDMNKLQLLEIQLKDKKIPEEINSNLEELKKRNSLLISLIETIHQQLEKIKNQFPVSFANSIEDSSWVESQNDETRMLISLTVEEIRKCEIEISLLLNSTKN